MKFTGESIFTVPRGTRRGGALFRRPQASPTKKVSITAPPSAASRRRSGWSCSPSGPRPRAFRCVASGQFGQAVSKFWRARSRLYRSQILQVNLRLKALAEIYTMHYFCTEVARNSQTALKSNDVHAGHS